MTLSVLDLFSIGLGPSSSHTVGPMRAARLFARSLADAGRLGEVTRVKAVLFGSLGATGQGHGSDHAVILGLAGLDPESVGADEAPRVVAEAVGTGRLRLDGTHEVAFSPDDVVLNGWESLPGHPNGMRLTAYSSEEAAAAAGTAADVGPEGAGVVSFQEYYSVGGGFVVTAEDLTNPADAEPEVPEPYPFATGDELLRRCRESGLSIAQVMHANELTRHSAEQIRESLLQVWAVMQECVENGCSRTEEVLPGGLEAKRRAPGLRRRLREQQAKGDTQDTLWAMEWVNLFALAVNEENASGGRVVTAPTNGAAGIIPAVLHYFDMFRECDDERVEEFLLTAGAIGTLFKRNASISGAEVGCQGEVGSACSMAAAGLCAVLGGSPEQVENAAEIGLEHNLGLTCDPIAGLVQIPCIERNAIASVKAINAARLSLAGDGTHRVSLDEAIMTMRDTGRDMMSKYKETSRGGLAVNVAVNLPEC
ncbi:L-serine ammonia-lyase [Citricoccus sp. I39-566]|uniref:L-serine ammonia-lyase n=1 Tax=Citricoccus sp. I39-566 TaxID=3073268 RepID=UPI00286BB809|nr:L-serine ammonia-lyase [Citricoccus sp. I39-566]WMY79304.1 L-serine ammonia-lyase [Citricoccus sp. I39-566]